MPAGPGRDQVAAMSRLVRIMAVLHNESPAAVKADRLVSIAGYGEADAKTQLGKDLNHLRRQGWQIENVEPKGRPAKYKMVGVDNRLHLKLTPEHQAALQRALILANRSDLAHRMGVSAGTLPIGLGSEVLPHEESVELTLAMQAVRLRSRVRFQYLGKPRLLSPSAVRFQHVQWYLCGVEEGGSEVKTFAVGRMSDVSLDLPGTAADVPEVRQIRLHPLQWEVDPPMEVTLRAKGEHVDDVKRWLDEPSSTTEDQDGVAMTYVVTNRASFRARVQVLGTRVLIAEPEEFRLELVAELKDLLGES